MLTIETYLDVSPGKGIGLFTKNKILKGSLWWIRNEKFDREISQNELNSLGHITVSFIKDYGFLEPTGNWYLCIDNGKYCNHKDFPNTFNILDETGQLVSCHANDDIMPGNEIFCNYRDFCLSSARNLGF